MIERFSRSVGRLSLIGIRGKIDQQFLTQLFSSRRLTIRE
jgi:hypothetical protein